MELLNLAPNKPKVVMTNKIIWLNGFIAMKKADAILMRDRMIYYYLVRSNQQHIHIPFFTETKGSNTTLWRYKKAIGQKSKYIIKTCLFSAILFLSLSGHGQFKRGGFTVGGDMSVRSETEENFHQTMWKRKNFFSVSPEYGFFVGENFQFGFKGSYTYKWEFTDFKDQYNSTSAYSMVSLGFYSKRYIFLSKKLGCFLNLMASDNLHWQRDSLYYYDYPQLGKLGIFSKGSVSLRLTTSSL